MHWLTDWSRHFKFNSSNFMFSLFRWVGANIAYVLNARGILALLFFGKPASSFANHEQHLLVIEGLHIGQTLRTSWTQEESWPCPPLENVRAVLLCFDNIRAVQQQLHSLSSSSPEKLSWTASSGSWDSIANWDLRDGRNYLPLASNYLKPRLIMTWQKLKKYPPENPRVPPHVLIVFYGVQNSAGTSNVQHHVVRTFFFSFGLFRPCMHCFGGPQ